MTTDPERLLHPDGEATELERELLGSVRDVAPRGNAKAVAWSGIAARLAAASLVGAGTAASTSAAAAKTGGAGLVANGLLTKVVLAVAVTGGAVGGGYFLKQRASAGDPPPVATPRETKPAAASETRGDALPAVAPAAEASREPEPSAPEAAVGDPAPVAPARAKRRAGTPAEMLEAESGLLTEARAALRSGDTEGASRTLERLRTEFPAGVLVQEREVLAIEVLARRGETTLAAQRAERFIRAHPTSPHSAALRRLLAKP